MEDDFYATLKFKNGEEIFAKIAASEENNRTMLVVHHPILVQEIKSKNGLIGYKVEPWLKTTKEDMFIINMDNILTLSESSDMNMILMHQNFVKDCDSTIEECEDGEYELSREMGYLGTVSDNKEVLEKLFKLDSPENKSS